MKFNLWTALGMTAALLCAGCTAKAAENEESQETAPATILQDLNVEIMFNQDTYAKSSDEMDAQIDHFIKKYTKGTLLQYTISGLAKVQVNDVLLYVMPESFDSGEEAIAQLTQRKSDERKMSYQQLKEKEEEEKQAKKEAARQKEREEHMTEEVKVNDVKINDVKASEVLEASQPWDGKPLNKVEGVKYGPSGKETYYNLPMGGVISIMRAMGNTDRYWVREDGVKMLGDYVMVAAQLDLRPRGSLVPTSLGMGIVCDTGTFALKNPTQLDIAVDW
ncbi:MAG: hypothetical protein HUJ55_01755 [Ileibacterium sp.]|nr:hypothetical protein [Ileibacterium sp.]